MTAEIEVRLIAHTQLEPDYYAGLPMELDPDSPADSLHEFAGRECYQSFHKPNPATAENDSYLKHIIESGHHSVVEHSSFTFRVTGVSRALLLELERHRGLSFSVLSQRYVSPHKYGLSYVEPPVFSDSKSAGRLRHLQEQHWEHSLAAYDEAYHIVRAEGGSLKEAREAARCFLPNSAETRFIVTGNIRTWRHVLYMRSAPGADREIRRFADIVALVLKGYAPNSVQGIPGVTPYRVS